MPLSPFLSASVIVLGSVSCGIATAFPSPTGAAIQSYFSMSDWQIDKFKSVQSLVSIVGPFFASAILSVTTRRAALRVSAALCALSWGVLLLARSDGVGIWLAYAHRALVGLSVGAYFGIVPLYLREITPPHLRDRYGTFHQFGISVGGLLCNLLGAFLPWRALAAAMALLPLAQLLLASRLPDSPVRPGAERRGESGAIRDLFAPRVLAAIGFLALLFALQQVSGIGSIQTNLSRLLKSTFGPSIAASSKVFAGFVAAFVISTLGRNGTWFVSVAGCGGCLLIVAFGKRADSEVMAVAGTFGYLFSFCLGLGPIPWTLLPAYFDDKVRAIASSVLAAANSLGTFLMTQMWSGMTARFGEFGLLAGMGGITLAGVVLGLFFRKADERPKEEKAKKAKGKGK